MYNILFVVADHGTILRTILVQYNIHYNFLLILVPDRRGWEQQVHPILANNMIVVIKYVCTVYVPPILLCVC
jgi:hypothetical protein